jgi:hypothetical protein
MTASEHARGPRACHARCPCARWQIFPCRESRTAGSTLVSPSQRVRATAPNGPAPHVRSRMRRPARSASSRSNIARYPSMPRAVAMMSPSPGGLRGEVVTRKSGRWASAAGGMACGDCRARRCEPSSMRPGCPARWRGRTTITRHMGPQITLQRDPRAIWSRYSASVTAGMRPLATGSLERSVSSSRRIRCSLRDVPGISIGAVRSGLMGGHRQRRHGGGRG